MRKGATLCEVAVRKDDDGAWKATGRVCLAEGVSAQGAVTRQRALIEEHGKRLHLALASQAGKALLQVGYRPADGADFAPVGKKGADDVPVDDAEIGFEGLPDPASGYYCSYKDGKLVTPVGVGDPSVNTGRQ